MKEQMVFSLIVQAAGDNPAANRKSRWIFSSILFPCTLWSIIQMTLMGCSVSFVNCSKDVMMQIYAKLSTRLVQDAEI